MATAASTLHAGSAAAVAEDPRPTPEAYPPPAAQSVSPWLVTHQSRADRVATSTIERVAGHAWVPALIGLLVLAAATLLTGSGVWLGIACLSLVAVMVCKSAIASRAAAPRSFPDHVPARDLEPETLEQPVGLGIQPAAASANARLSHVVTTLQQENAALKQQCSMLQASLRQLQAEQARPGHHDAGWAITRRLPTASSSYQASQSQWMPCNAGRASSLAPADVPGEPTVGLPRKLVHLWRAAAITLKAIFATLANQSRL